MRVRTVELNRGMVMSGQCASALSPEAMHEARQKMERAAKNKLWAMSNLGRLRSKYANKYVALDEGRVLAFGDSPDEVFRELRKKKIVDISTVAVEFVPEGILVWLL